MDDPKTPGVFSAGWQNAIVEWREQSFALFGQRAHAHFGRGFVLIDSAEERPIYVTHLAGAPPGLFQEVQHYRPDQETVFVSKDDEDADVLIVRRIRIEPRQ
jgi:hypothetical protein